MSARTQSETAEPRDDQTNRMKAIVQREYGSTDTLTLAEINIPEIGSGEVLIAVHAAGVDRGVWHLMTGLPYLVRLAGYGVTRPKSSVPGFDVAGRVVAVGETVKRFEVGHEVFGIAAGSYAEYAVAAESKLAHKPSNVSYEAAAAAAISGITALQALTDVGHVEAGQSVLVIGASGGVGSYAVQLAKALGAIVTGVASATNLDMVRSLGADHVADYRESPYLSGQKRYDLIIDTGGRNPVRALRKALTDEGTLVIVGGEGGGRVTGGIGRQVRAAVVSLFVRHRLAMFISKEDYRCIERLARYMADGEVTPAIGRRYTLSEVPTAIEDLASGMASGKSVIVIGDGQDEMIERPT